MLFDPKFVTGYLWECALHNNKDLGAPVW